MIRRAARFIANALAKGSDAVARVEWLTWALLVAAIAAPRVWLHALCPVYIWSADSAGYLYPALQWLDHGTWLSDPRRGPIYSGFIALALKFTGNLSAVAVAQQWICGAAILGLCLALRARCGRRALLPILVCGITAAIYGLPLYLAQLIRNEALLMGAATLALVGLQLGLADGKHRLAWLVLGGFGGALVNLTKSVFMPWPALGLIAILWPRREGNPRWVLAATAFVLGYALPMGTAKLAEKLWPGSVAGVSYAGIQLYGRVAQWTVIDGGIYPEIKEAIRPLVIDYRGRKKLDNNWVIKRGIIPVIGKTIGDTGERSVDTICRALAIEAIRAHPREFFGQATADFGSFLFEMGWKERVPKHKDLKKLAANIERLPNPHPAMHAPEVIAVYRGADSAHFSPYHRMIRSAFLFEAWSPVMIASIILVLLCLLDRADRPFWIAAAGIWFFNLVILSTVGKPMHRYLMPLIPVMILVTGTALCRAWMIAQRGARTG
jgi:hypothetical protein